MHNLHSCIEESRRGEWENKHNKLKKRKVTWRVSEREAEDGYSRFEFMCNPRD